MKLIELKYILEAHQIDLMKSDDYDTEPTTYTKYYKRNQETGNNDVLYFNEHDNIYLWDVYGEHEVDSIYQGDDIGIIIIIK